MMKITRLLIMFALFLTGCVEYKDDPICSEYNYVTLKEVRSSVKVKAPREVQNAGKIYIYENLVVINEPNKGVHLIDNQDKYNPIALVFIEIPGNIDIAVKNGYLYVDSFVDLVVIDINDLTNIYEINREEDIFTYDRYQALSADSSNIENECDYGDEKGFVIGVEK
ncbi:MAG: hypothetical protein U9O86_09620 [Campylobacterota bacterium]|nr:hypothetical protein [Campylobacterota bacterium]